MGKIKYQYYDNYNDYPKNNNFKRSHGILISEWELKKYSLLNAVINGHVLSKEGKEYYLSIYKMAIKECIKDGYICSADYIYAESSYKTGISFAMGMIATRIVALKKYGIVHLFHLKDKAVKYSGNGKEPDWIGVNSYGELFLFESKGTDKTSLDKNVRDCARKQLDSIKSISIRIGNTMNTYTVGINKHIIVSCFKNDKYNKIKKRWYIQDIDPEEEGEVEIELNLDEKCYEYYEKLVFFLDSCNTQCEEIEIMQRKYRFWFFEEEKVGICCDIYDVVKCGKCIKEKRIEGFYERVKSILKINKIEDGLSYEDGQANEASSSYEDGIIVCNVDAFR